MGLILLEYSMHSHHNPPQPFVLSLVQALVPSDGGWQSSFSVESVLLLVLSNMVDCDFGTTKTAVGTVADTGPLRIALSPHSLQVRLTPVLCPSSSEPL